MVNLLRSANYVIFLFVVNAKMISAQDSNEQKISEHTIGAFFALIILIGFAIIIRYFRKKKYL